MKLKITIVLILSVINCKAQDFPKKELMAVFDIKTFNEHKENNRITCSFNNKNKTVLYVRRVSNNKDGYTEITEG